MLPFENPALSPAERAADLCARLTLREKVGQLNQRLHGFESYTRNGMSFSLSEEFTREVERWGGLGFLYGLYRADPWSQKDFTNGLVGDAAPRIFNEVQRYVISHSRFGIPVLLCEESPHGHQALDGYLLPVNLAMGCAFDPPLAEKAFRVVGEQMKALHTDLALVSMLDMLRDPRWGRSEECYSEDPLLASRMAAAAVRGLRSSGMDAVAKHCAAQGETTGGVNASAARIGERELREIHLPAVKAAAEAGVSGVMAAYNEIDGVPCHGNSWLLNDVLRGEFGFRGFVMADGVAIDRLDLVSSPDFASRGATALNAGVDVSLWDRGFTALEEAAEKGLVSEAQIDEAVRRVLTLKFARGLFEHPYMEEKEPAPVTVSDHPETLDLARESVVLLKNDAGALPLSRSLPSLAVIGPFADDVYAQLGDYTPPQRPGASVSYLEGIRNALKGTACDVRAFCSPVPADAEERAAWIRDAAALAGNCAATVLVLGGSSSRFRNMVFEDNGAVRGAEETGKTLNLTDCGEGVDTADISLPLWQRELLAAVRGSVSGGRPLAVLLNAGRPYASDSYAPFCDAALCAFYGGPQAGTAAAEILFGDVNPGGRLSVSIPRVTGAVPAAYNLRASYDRRYTDLNGPACAYGFGYGLSYTEFALDGFELSSGDTVLPAPDFSSVPRGICGPQDGRPPEIPVLSAEKAAGDGLCLRFRIANAGDRSGDAVPMLFIRRQSGSVIPRLRELKDFVRVRLGAGQSETAVLRLTPEALAVLPRDMSGGTRIEPGTTELILWEGDLVRWHSAVRIEK